VRLLPDVEVMSLRELFEHYRPGSHDWPWTWEEEIRDVLYNPVHYPRSSYLMEHIEEYGIQEPVLLGSDRRVWDGHHRLAIAFVLSFEYVPVDFVKSYYGKRPSKASR
jgi:hypothetical protein